MPLQLHKILFETALTRVHTLLEAKYDSTYMRQYIANKVIYLVYHYIVVHVNVSIYEKYYIAR